MKMNLDKQKAVSPRKVLLLGLGLVGLVVGLVLSIVLFLPRQIPIKYHHADLFIDILGIPFQYSQEQRLAILVVLAGALGSTVHASTSFSKYLGMQRFYVSWIWWYLLRPFVGGMLALIVYFGIRGGILVNGNGPESINLFGILTLAALSGMFSKQAIDKLNSMFSKLFSSLGNDNDEKTEPPEAEDRGHLN